MSQPPGEETISMPFGMVMMEPIVSIDGVPMQTSVAIKMLLAQRWQLQAELDEVRTKLADLASGGQG